MAAATEEGGSPYDEAPLWERACHGWLTPLLQEEAEALVATGVAPPLPRADAPRVSEQFRRQTH